MQSLVQYDCSSDSTSEEDLPGSSHSDDVKYNQHKNGTGSKTQMSNGDEIRDSIENKQHQGRIRSFEHERGNWASYISIPVPNLDDFDELADSLIDMLSSVCRHPHPFHKIDDPHISLTRTLKLRHHWLPDMTKSLGHIAESHRRFYLSLRDVAVYTNDENTRSFIGIKVSSGQDKMINVMKDLNDLLSTYNLPPFYEEPSFHVSLCWCLMDAKSELTSAVLLKLQDCVDEWLKDNEQCGFFPVNYLIWKAGNKQTPLPLDS